MSEYLNIHDRLIEALIDSNEKLGYQSHAEQIRKWWDTKRTIIEAQEVASGTINRD